jgi:hypothetical protein
MPRRRRKSSASNVPKEEGQTPNVDSYIGTLLGSDMTYDWPQY